MKKNHSILLACAALLVLSISNVNAKNDIFAVGDNNLNFQLGVGSNWYYGSYYHSSLPQLSVSYDHGLRDDWGPGIFGIGGFVSVATYNYTYWADEDYKTTDFNIAARATYHYQFVEKLDTYGGVIAGLKFRNNDAPDNSEDGVGTVGSIFAGVKYYFSDKVSVMSELHFGNVALFNIGIGLKF